MKPQSRTLLFLALGVVLGVAIWVFSPWLTGKVEPWDANTPFWSLSWLVVAVLGAFSGHARGICIPLGYAVGQMLVSIRPAFQGEFGTLGWLFILGHAVAAVIITLTFVGVMALFRWAWRSRSDKADGA